MVQWLGLGAFTAEGPGSILGQGTKILQAVQHIQKNKLQIKKIFFKRRCGTYIQYNITQP